jgi:dihydroxyacetone kinase-like protein
MQDFDARDGAVILNGLVKTIQSNAAALSDIDGAIGDGDHGVNMNKGFTLAAERLAGKGCTLGEGLSTLGAVLLGEIGGSMGPLYGTFFREMAKVCKGKQRIGSRVFAEMLEKAVSGVVGLGGAKVGDKTLLDVLVPALSAFREALGSGRDFAGALEVMKDAAEKGRESTRGMAAKIGRASRLGERSRGVLDAGAASCYLILSSMARSVQSLLEEGS